MSKRDASFLKFRLGLSSKYLAFLISQNIQFFFLASVISIVLFISLHNLRELPCLTFPHFQDCSYLFPEFSKRLFCVKCFRHWNQYFFLISDRHMHAVLAARPSGTPAGPGKGGRAHVVLGLLTTHNSSRRNLLATIAHPCASLWFGAFFRILPKSMAYKTWPLLEVALSLFVVSWPRF